MSAVPRSLLSPLLIPLLILGFAVSAASANVVTTLEGSKLTVTGDSSPDTLLIEPAGDGVVLTGSDGTLVDGGTEPVTVLGVRKLVAKLAEGPDRLTLRWLRLPDGINLGLGRGNDDVVLYGVDGGATRIQGSHGSDAVRLYGPSQLGQLSVQTGSGFDWVVVDGVWVRGDLDVDTGNDEDDVTIVATDVDDDLDVELRDDDDVLLLDDVVVYDDADFDGGNGDNALLLGFIWVDDDVDVDDFDGDWWWW